jgi:Flp pilus assembly protein TadG
MKRIFTKYRSDNTGVMTMEFMVMLPILLMWFAGLFVFFDAFQSWMKTLKASYTVSDILTRQTVVDDAYIDTLDGVFDSISQSRDGAETFMRVSQVKNSDGTLEMMWTHATVEGQILVDATIDDVSPHVPTLMNNEYVIVFQTYRPFNPLFDWVGLSETVFENVITSPLRFTSSLVNTDHPESVADSNDGVDTDDPSDQP